MKKFYQIWLSDLNCGYKVKNEIVESECKNIFECDTLCQLKRVLRDIEKKNRIKASNFKDIEEKLNKTEMLGIKTLDTSDMNYPQYLRELDDKPLVLYYYGNIEGVNNSKKISIVGSRKSTAYGEGVLSELIKHLKEYKIETVSGGALGIDTVCHRESLKKNIRTYSVLGSGLDNMYPSSNEKMFEEIIEMGGAVISEFTVKTPPKRYNFPRRNRIISGMSMLLLIVEAGEKSGTLITLGQALQQGRDVMAVPGSIFAQSSKGCNRIIKEGAYIYNDISDIVEILNLEKKSNFHSEKHGHIDKINHIVSQVPMHFDEIKRNTGIDIRTLYELLFEMQHNNLIKCINGNFYVKGW